MLKITYVKMKIGGGVVHKAGQEPLEEFIFYNQIAYMRDNIRAMIQLTKRCPELLERSLAHDDLTEGFHPDDLGEEYLHPVTSLSTRMTVRRVLDMVAYLLGCDKAPRKYRIQLQNSTIPSRTVFNYAVSRYQQDYDREEIWKSYFLALPELRRIIEYRCINSLAELEYRAAEYFTERRT